MFTARYALLPMIWQGSSHFIEWGMMAVLRWQNSELPILFYHLRDTRDEVFPHAYLTPTHTIRGGSHMLVLSHPEEVNTLLTKILTQMPVPRNFPPNSLH